MINTPSAPLPDPAFWKCKLAAYLHDPPSKCVNIRLHEEHAKSLYRQAGFTDEDELRRLGDIYAQPSDWTASAADRFPFPVSRNNLRSSFDGVRSQFHHPLSRNQPFRFHKEFQSAEAAMEVDQELQPAPDNIDDWAAGEQWRARYFCHWRLWEQFCTEKDYRFAFLPGETRLPDHTVWTHMQVTAALDSCAGGTGKDAVLKPAFLKFQLGPVQEFIAEARSVRDLWSGSYLLSWLMAAALKVLAMEAGPDAVIFPNLKGQPLIDLHLKDSLWSQVKVNGKTVWNHLAHEPGDLLTPNLPNVFLAVVHRDRVQDLGQRVEGAVRQEWTKIATAVWEFCEKAGMIPADEAGFTAEARRERFEHQSRRFLSLSWQATPWPENLETALKLAENFDAKMPIRAASERVLAIVRYATGIMPEADRDGRYYQGGNQGPKTKLNNIGLGWSVILAYNGWELDAVRRTRAFDAWSGGGWETGLFSNKDSLGGKAEAVAGGRSWTEAAARHKDGLWKSLFKHEDWLGAATLIKRVWHLAYLKKVWGLPTDSREFPMPNTHQIAAHRQFASGDDEDEEKLAGEKYYAVLALDGDEIGKWVSGEKTPTFRDQFSDYHDSSGAQREGALRYFEEHGGEGLLATGRALSPSYHLQFSQALSNFALLCARRVVEAHHGRLIYAGGDDVLAMLPADRALECGQALREAFQGRAVPGADLDSPAPGYLSVSKDQNGHPVAFPVPGSEAEVSVGIAIAHFKSPLQDVVRAAQAAEKRAKRDPGKGGHGRAAVALTLLKRSGEISEWGTPWKAGGTALYDAIAQALQAKEISAKFPHRVCQLLVPYLHGSSLSDAAGFEATEIIRREFTFAMERQSLPGKLKTASAGLLPALEAYLTALAAAFLPNHPQAVFKAIDGLCTTVAFAHRTSRETSSAERQSA